ncbi:carboxypeptidase B1 [Stomoxys calcitrans]|uniref:Peptidase M14 domain-containing protein n=1 Tax=Stomoxys calcitrans TaxID=35570 RepID=A0A1I8QAI6_STOCA|nr:carboxypeptidase B1 [Stomoxys calcitrans]
MFFKIALSVLFCSIALASGETYEGYKIYDIQADNVFEKEILLRLSANEAYDFFDLPRVMGKPARAMIQPEDQVDFETTLTRFGLTFEVINENVAQSIAEETEQQNYVRSAADTNGRISFAAFQRFSAINAYLDELAAAYPNRVTVKTLGQSYEKRAMKAITITNGDGKANKKVILMDAGIHAREWIAPAGALYVIHQLVEKFSANSHLLKDYDWVILPVVNPDGYEYTHTSSRMWRKTRQPVSSSCYGTDGNRNFDFHWGEVGASSLSCADTFRGPTAFSEPETKLLRDLMHSLSGRAKMYLTLHSYGNYLLYPWGYTSALPATVKDLDEVAQAGAAAIRSATGTRYTVGSSTNVLYAAAGGSDDYAFAKANIPISITMELPAGGSGFDPKPAQIDPFVSETWIGIKAMAEKVIAKY